MTYRHVPAFARVAARLRARGFTVTEVPGWATRGHGDLGAIAAVVDHHTVDRGPADYPSLTVVRDGRPDLAGPLCQWGVGRRGGIYLVAAGLAWHAGAVREAWMGNSRSVGVEIANTGTGEPYSPACWAAVVALNEELAAEFTVPPGRVLGHKEVCAPAGRKTDPSFDMGRLRAVLGSRPGPAGAPPTPTPSLPAPQAPAQRFLGPFPLPAGHWFGPASPDARNHSGYWAEDRPHIAALLDALRRRGWKNAPATDRYTADVTALVKRYQHDARLDEDGACGVATWESIATSPVR